MSYHSVYIVGVLLPLEQGRELEQRERHSLVHFTPCKWRSCLNLGNRSPGAALIKPTSHEVALIEATNHHDLP
jgi:hypothetical protein